MINPFKPKLQEIPEYKNDDELNVQNLASLEEKIKKLNVIRAFEKKSQPLSKIPESEP